MINTREIPCRFHYKEEISSGKTRIGAKLLFCNNEQAPKKDGGTNKEATLLDRSLALRESPSAEDLIPLVTSEYSKG